MKSDVKTRTSRRERS